VIGVIKSAFNAFVRLFYPRVCAGCGGNLLSGEEHICLVCHQNLVPTQFNLRKENAFFKTMSARVPIEAATAMYYFTKGGIIQHILHEIKYKGNRALAVYLGQIFGKKNLKDDIFSTVDVVVPVPLHPKKEKSRGYNQCALIGSGIAEVMGKRLEIAALKRVNFTTTQTHKGRTDRWENVKDAFELGNTDALKGKHILLLDDVMTTGATLEACARTLMNIEGVRLSIATLVYTDEL
jgi:ComF family protein